MCKQKRRAKQLEEYLQSRDDELEFSCVPYSDPNKNGHLLVMVIEGGGGGALAGINNRFKMIIKKIEETSKEKHSLMRKLVVKRRGTRF